MFESCYRIYKSCFPDYPVSYENFCEMLNIKKSKIFCETDEDEIVGFAIAGSCNIAVVAVEKAYRGKGIGKNLVGLCEEYIRNNGHKSVKLGVGDASLFQGVPTDNDGDSEVYKFFEKCGYKHSHLTYNMDIDTYCFEYVGLDIPKPENITYRLAGDSDKEELLKAVEQVEPDWVELYKSCDDDVLLAICDGEIAGFEMVNEYGGNFTKGENVKHGCIGCVGTVPKFRKRGIGLDMTANAVQRLRALGCDKVQLLYLVLDKWYGKLGFYITSTQWMGEKKL
ncbi:MAG: GNAT family N-acetyltransferase [Ruminiclostridium sp.]|nr:GNAT family N-acetyltransferase [Ruminiclostridium sp.]